MKAQLIKAGEEHRIMSESDFQELVLLMKILREKDKFEFITQKVDRTLTIETRSVVTRFLNDNGYKE